MNRRRDLLAAQVARAADDLPFEELTETDLRELLPILVELRERCLSRRVRPLHMVPPPD